MTSTLLDHQECGRTPNGGQVLLDGGGREPPLELLDVGGHGDGLDAPEGKPPLLAPAEELGDGLGVCESGVRILDVSREELDEASRGPSASVADEGRDDQPARPRPDSN
jgi:hypothetical protein